MSQRRPFEEEGPDDYRVPEKDRVKDELVRRPQKMGYAVTASVAGPAA